MNNTENEKTNVEELTEKQAEQVVGGRSSFAYSRAIRKYDREYLKGLNLSKEEYAQLKAQFIAMYGSAGMDALFKGLC